MKSTGIVRRVDQLGRIVIPSELRKSMEMDPRDSIEIFVEGSTVIFKKYIPACIFCGETEDVGDYKEKKVCKSCLENLRK